MLRTLSPFAALQMQVRAKAQAGASYRRTTEPIHEVRHRRSHGLPVLRRSAHRLFLSDERCAGVCSTVVPLSKEGFNTKDKQPPQFGLLMQRSWSSLALRSTAAPGTAGSVGTGFARAASARALRHRNTSVAPVANARMLRHQEQGVALVVLEGLFRPQPRPNPNGTYFGVLAEGNACK